MTVLHSAKSVSHSLPKSPRKGNRQGRDILTVDFENYSLLICGRISQIS
jgi:hypothetical protein